MTPSTQEEEIKAAGNSGKLATPSAANYSINNPSRSLYNSDAI
jgi:hypothetical protein